MSGDKLRVFHFDLDLTGTYLFWAGLIGAASWRSALMASIS